MMNMDEDTIYKRYEDGFIVREMQGTEASLVMGWFKGEFGAVSHLDLKMALKVFPPGGGFYIGEIHGEPVASAIRIPWCNDIFYGSLYYVKKAHRGKGYGTRLRDEVARAYVGDKILCIDAVQGVVAAKNKQKFGYDFVFKSSRVGGTAKSSYGISLQEGQIVDAKKIDIKDLLHYDDKCFVAPNNPVRHHFLRELLQLSDGASYVALDQSGDVVGFGSRRPCDPAHIHNIGPLYGNSPGIVEALLECLCHQIAGQEVFFQVCLPNKHLESILAKFNFNVVFELDRMQINGEPILMKQEVFALTSLAVCGF